MGEMSKAEVVAQLLKNGNAPDQAQLYADVFMEYREATANIEKNGLIVAHPRTGQPMKNPYVEIRDSALRKFQTMRHIKAAGLWPAGMGE